MSEFIRKCIAILAVCTALFCISACSSAKPETVDATVVEIERFGHVVLDISTADFCASGYELGDIVCVNFGSYKSDMPFFDGYYTNPDEVMLRGTAPEENIAICINYGNFSEETGIAIGETVRITMTEKAGMLELQELYALQYSNDRADYSDDAVFANFRAVTVGDIGEGKLYRSASPINNEFGRAAYADKLIADAGVAVILNLADSNEDIEEFYKANDFDSEYYYSIYGSGDVMCLGLGADFFSDEFAESIADGLTFLAQNEPPYCIHCTEGKDRAGFTAMLLEALMGAELTEIEDDYMRSFYNYYGIDKENEPARYDAVLNNNLIAMLCHVTGAKNVGQLEETDLEAAVTEYLLGAGMKEENIRTLKEKLG